jgi:hypothetical protein
VEDLIVKDDEAVVELHSQATAKNGMRFDNRYCWVVYFQEGLIVRVRVYLDSAMVVATNSSIWQESIWSVSGNRFESMTNKNGCATNGYTAGINQRI